MYDQPKGRSACKWRPPYDVREPFLGSPEVGQGSKKSPGLFFLCRLVYVDNGLKKWNGDRRLPKNISESDLPEMARAITELVRGNAVSRVQAPKNARFVQIITRAGHSTAFRKEHWVKILPLIQDGTFSPLDFPVVKTAGPGVEDPLYPRVLFYLSQLFI